MKRLTLITLFLISQSLVLNGIQKKSGRVIEFQINRGSSSALDAFKQRVSSGFVIVDFYAPWCGPCKSIAPAFSDLSSLYPQVVFLKVDIDDYNQIAQAYNIKSIPQLLFFKNGTKVETLIGKQTKNTIVCTLDKHFK